MEETQMGGRKTDERWKHYGKGKGPGNRMKENGSEEKKGRKGKSGKQSNGELRKGKKT